MFDKNKIKAIIFDLDGTLLNTEEGIDYAVNKTASDLGLEPVVGDAIRNFIGPPIREGFANVYNMDKDEALAAASHFRDIYKAESLFMACLYPEVIETICALKEAGYLIGVATNKVHANAVKVLEHFGVAKLCDHIAGVDVGGALRKSDLVNANLKAMDISADEAILVGDSVYDKEGADESKVGFIAATYGFGFRSGDEGIECYISEFKSLRDIFIGNI